MKGTEKMLVMREIPEGKFKSFLSNKDSLAACDVAIFIHDCSSETSCREASKMLMEVARQGEVTGYGMPCILVSAKNDLESHPSAVTKLVEVCEEMGMQIPIKVSAKQGDMNAVFSSIVNAAQCPHLGIPETKTGRIRKKYRRFIDHSLILLAVGAAVSGVGMAAYRANTARRHTTPNYAAIRTDQK